MAITAAVAIILFFKNIITLNLLFDTGVQNSDHFVHVFSGNDERRYKTNNIRTGIDQDQSLLQCSVNDISHRMIKYQTLHQAHTTTFLNTVVLFSQLIQTLYRQADRVHRGRLPVPVHLLIDEFPNISLPKDSFLSALATMRSRGIFCSIIAQNMAQLKAMYKNDWESLVGLCDEFLYLGGNEQGTHKYVSELIGKETISIASYNRSRGRNGSYSVNRQTSGRELLKPDEVRLLGDDKAILFVRGERPILDDKYDLLRHPNIRFTEDGGASPYDYTAAAGAANDLPGQPEQYELLDMDDFEDKPKVSAQQNLQTNLIYRNRR